MMRHLAGEYNSGFELLCNTDDTDILYVVNILNTVGFYFPDEHNKMKLVTVFKYWTDKCLNYLVDNYNYSGGDIYVTAKYFSGYGNVYAAYDTERYFHKEIQGKLVMLGQKKVAEWSGNVT